jgi:hypothetical protein
MLLNLYLAVAQKALRIFLLQKAIFFLQKHNGK